jgi:prephenate dehydratase
MDVREPQIDLRGIAKELEVHTLGPTGTNCEAAARHWMAAFGVTEPTVKLHSTLEDAAEVVLADTRRRSVLLGCVVYPDLHNLVFKNLAGMSLLECFVMPTHAMVYAGNGTDSPETAASHPAPVSLIESMGLRIRMANSNAEAALLCASGEVDACITTAVAAERAGLTVIKDFGPVPMGFSIHAPHGLGL